MLDEVKALKSHGMTGSSEMRHAAKIPTSVIENYIARLGITFHEFMANPKHINAMLNDPDLAGFRIWQGKV